MEFLACGIDRRYWVSGILIGLSLGSAIPSLAQADTIAELQSHYRDLIANVDASPFHAPISIASGVQGDVYSAEVYGVLDQPYAAVAKIIETPARWCEFMSLSLHIKSCTSQASTAHVTLYAGTKDYQTPDEAYEITYAFTVATTPDAITVQLEAPSGPMGTKSNRIAVEAAGTDGHTVLHFTSSIQMSTLSRVATSTYLATLGRHRIGFSFVADGNGNKIPIKGVKGMIERNAMRYFLALQTLLEQRNTAPEQRFEQSMSRWFDHAENYHDQLYELPKDEYLANKRREHANQVALQQRIDAKLR